MPLSALASGAILFLLGPIFYLLGDPGHRSLTAFIPSVFGFLILACGLAALNAARTKMAMHAAVGIALIGALGAFARILPKMGDLARGQIAGQLGLIASLIMFVVCAVFVAASIGRFIQMRRA